MTLLKGLSGYVPVRDNFALDYCAQLAVESLLPVCDEVLIGDAGSSDQTLIFFREWAYHDPRIRIVNCILPPLPTPEQVEKDEPGRPQANAVMLIDWLNQIRAHCRFDMQITLDADEVLDPASYRDVRYAKEDRIPRWFKRINLWGSPQWEAPHGTVCGEWVTRMGPTEMKMHSDEPCYDGEPEIRRLAVKEGDLTIIHLGFLRRQNAFLKKSRLMQAWLHNTYDPRLRKAEETGEPWHELSPFPENRPLLPVTRRFPVYVNRWLQERGYTV